MPRYNLHLQLGELSFRPAVDTFIEDFPEGLLSRIALDQGDGSDRIWINSKRRTDPSSTGEWYQEMKRIEEKLRVFRWKWKTDLLTYSKFSPEEKTP